MHTFVIGFVSNVDEALSLSLDVADEVVLDLAELLLKVLAIYFLKQNQLLVVVDHYAFKVLRKLDIDVWRYFCEFNFSVVF